MYSLRVFQKAGKEYTNTHVKMFDAQNHSVTLTQEDFKTVDWETCIFQVYPADPTVNAFYTTITKDSSLFLFHMRTGLLLGETSFPDQYIYFKPDSPNQDYQVVLCVAEDVYKARSSLGLYIK